MITQAVQQEQVEMEIISEIEEFDQEQYKFDAAVVDQMGNDSDVNTLAPSRAAAQIVDSNPQKRMEQKLEEELIDVSAPPLDPVTEPAMDEFADVIEVTGDTEHPGGVEGSIDLLTQEIALSLKERKTLVVWLFDESGSMEERRNAIADRFENIYAQLGQMKQKGDL